MKKRGIINKILFDNNKRPRIFSPLLFFIPTLFLIKINSFSIYIGALLAVSGCIWGVYVNQEWFKICLRKKRYYWAAPLFYIFILLFIALLFSYVQAIAYSQHLGYLKYGDCDNSVDFKDLTLKEISQLPGFVEFDSIKPFYFNIITLTTLGYGDIFPQGDTFRLISIIEVLVGLSITIIFVSIAVRVFRRK